MFHENSISIKSHLSLLWTLSFHECIEHVWTNVSGRVDEGVVGEGCMHKAHFGNLLFLLPKCQPSSSQQVHKDDIIRLHRRLNQCCFTRIPIHQLLSKVWTSFMEMIHNVLAGYVINWVKHMQQTDSHPSASPHLSASLTTTFSYLSIRTAERQFLSVATQATNVIV